MPLWLRILNSDAFIGAVAVAICLAILIFAA